MNHESLITSQNLAIEPHAKVLVRRFDKLLDFGDRRLSVRHGRRKLVLEGTITRCEKRDSIITPLLELGAQLHIGAIEESIAEVEDRCHAAVRMWRCHKITQLAFYVVRD